MDENAGQKLAGLISGYWMAQAVYVAAKLELADHLAKGARSSNELAQATRTHEPSLFRLLRALASVGVFREVAPRQFELTPPASLLRKDVPGSQWAMAVMMGEEHYAAWGELLYSVQTGAGALRKKFGLPIFDYLSQHREAAQIFDQAMTSIHGRETEPIIGSYDFAQFGQLVDIGGGNGTLLAALLARHTTVQGTLFDLPHVIDRARQHHADSPLGARLAFQSGDFFAAVPAGANAYLMRHIIHDWNDEQCTTILRNIAQVMAPGGKVLVVESVIQPGNEFDFGKWLDLTMLVIPEGKERTADEYRVLFAGAGLKLVEIVPTGSAVSILVAERG